MKGLIVGAALALGIAPLAAQVTVELKASDDVWVYGHSLNPAYDPLLRVWGDGVDAIHPCPPDDYHSFSYVKFQLPADFDPAKTYNVTSAVLTLTHQFNPGYTLDQGLAHPLRAYSLGDTWSEATWDFSQVGIGEPCPAEPFFGEGDLSQYQPMANRFPIPIDLLGKGGAQFNTYFNNALHNGGKLDFALCSTLAPADMSSVIFYLLISRDHASGLGPDLKITAQQAGKTISGTVALQNFKGNLAAVTITFQVRPHGSATVLETSNVPLSSGGGYEFQTAQSGTVDVIAIGSVWLRALQTVDLNGSTGAVDFSLIGGDADGSNSVDIKDINTELVHFAGTGPLGDVNGDSSVDLLDLTMSLVNFGLVGSS